MDHMDGSRAGTGGSGPLPTGKSQVAVGCFRNTDKLRSSMVQLILEGSPYGRPWMKY